jgi:hypothetical protein
VSAVGQKRRSQLWRALPLCPKSGGKADIPKPTLRAMTGPPLTRSNQMPRRNLLAAVVLKLSSLCWE